MHTCTVTAVCRQAQPAVELIDRPARPSVSGQQEQPLALDIHVPELKFRNFKMSVKTKVHKVAHCHTIIMDTCNFGQARSVSPRTQHDTLNGIPLLDPSRALLPSPRPGGLEGGREKGKTILTGERAPPPPLSLSFWSVNASEGIRPAVQYRISLKLKTRQNNLSPLESCSTVKLQIFVRYPFSYF